MGNTFSQFWKDQPAPERVLGKRALDDETPGSVKRVREESCAEFNDADVGITEYRNENRTGFRSIIKYLAEDFMVHELDLDGNEIHLTSLEMPTFGSKVTCLEPAKFDERVTALFSSDVAQQLRDMLDHPDDKTRTVSIDLGQSNADSPMSFYALLESSLNADMLVTNKNNVVTVRWQDSNTENQPGGDYLQFHVQKTGMDSMRASGVISRAAKLHSAEIRSAGNKDSRAVTVQAMTIYNGTASKLVAAREQLESQQIYLGDFRYVPQGLTLGDLGGNMFSIVLRDVTGTSKAEIEASLQAVADNGFLNYFGMQRFGDSSIGTHKIGLALLNNDYDEAMDLILKPRNGEKGNFAHARHLWQTTHDARAAMKAFPRQAHVERDLLLSYVSNKKNPRIAIKKLRSDKVSMYFHAYQSYIWNRVVSERTRRYGCEKPLVGDLVLVDPEVIPQSTFRVNDAGRRDPSKSKVSKVLTEEELGQYSIEDVVYPVPGYATVYPDNGMRDVYMELMERDGISSNAWRNEIRNLKGDYRPLIAKPRDMAWSFIHYDDPHAPLLSSDVDRLLLKPVQPNIPDGKYLSLKLHFKLRSSQYATTMLREITRSSTSSKTQANIIHA